MSRFFSVLRQPACGLGLLALLCSSARADAPDAFKPDCVAPPAESLKNSKRIERIDYLDSARSQPGRPIIAYSEYFGESGITSYTAFDIRTQKRSYSHKYIYDSNGRIIRDDYFNINNELSSQSIVTYNNQGVVQEIKELTLLAGKKNLQIERKIVCRNIQGKLRREEYSYITGAERKSQAWKEYALNASGQLITERGYLGGANSPIEVSRMVYAYGSSKSLYPTGINIFGGFGDEDGLVEIVNIKLNAQGLVTAFLPPSKLNEVSETYLLLAYVEPKFGRIDFIYKYDNFGNWIRKEKQYRSKDNKVIKIDIEDRVIIYKK